MIYITSLEDAIDKLVGKKFFIPQDIYDALSPSPLRWLEHEDIKPYQQVTIKQIGCVDFDLCRVAVRFDEFLHNLKHFVAVDGETYMLVGSKGKDTVSAEPMYTSENREEAEYAKLHNSLKTIRIEYTKRLKDKIHELLGPGDSLRLARGSFNSNLIQVKTAVPYRSEPEMINYMTFSRDSTNDVDLQLDTTYHYYGSIDRIPLELLIVVYGELVTH